MAESRTEQMARLVEQIRQDPSLPGQLPRQEGAIVSDALNGRSVEEIAQAYHMTEEAVWALLGNAARAASGRAPAEPTESGGMGSDTDPGVSGGYGETGFGSLGNEPPPATPEEPA